MATVSAFEAKTRFGELLERVTRGEEIVITRHDKPVARIVPEGAQGSVGYEPCQSKSTTKWRR
jgi:prevent-host-death family protein